MEIFEKEIVRLLRKEVGGKGKLSSRQITELLEVPGDAAHGDWAFPCFSLAKTRREAPHRIAAHLAEVITPNKTVHQIEAKGGYVNFFINPEILAQTVLQQIFSEGEAYGAVDVGKGRRMVMEYSSPNIAKPFGIGHLRSTNIGNALARIHKFLHYDVVSINHLGDWGTQFGKVIAAYKRWGHAGFLKGDPIVNLYQLYVRFHEEEKNDPSLTDEARDWFRRLEQGDQEVAELWEWFRDLTMQELRGIYAIFDIHFDHQTGESFFTDKMPAVVDALARQEILEESEGAHIVRLEEENLPPAIIKKRDGSTLYITRDLAAAVYRHQHVGFDQMVYVVGTPQALHFQQLFALLKRLGHDWAAQCEHVGFGHMAFQDGGSMSTRSGNILFLKDVLGKAEAMSQEIIEAKNPELADKEKVATQVAIGALIYADFSSKRRKDVKFSWEEILNFEGETGPYLQYTSVRIRSLLAKFTGTVTANVEYAKLTSLEEAALIKQLGFFAEALEVTAREKEPFQLADYLMQLAKLYNKFYNRFRVLDQDGEISLARILLTQCTSQVLDRGLGLLGIPIPDKM